MLSYFHDVALDAHLFYHVAYVTRAVTTPMQRARANGELSSIAAGHSGCRELHSIAVDQQTCQLTGRARRPTAS